MGDLLIVDVNNAHPMRDWDAYAAFSGVAIAKMTEGATFLAPTFAKHRDGARKAGLRAFGAYHFWSPGVDPVTQAKNAVAALGELRTDPVEWLLLDVETGTDFAAYEAFCRHTDAALGRITWMYGGHQLKDHAPHRPRWVARYFDHTPNPKHAPGINETLWQFTDKFDVPGVGPADCSVYRGTAEQLVTFVRGGRMATLDKDDLAAIEAIVRKTLNEGKAHGQQSWATTSQAVLAGIQKGHNDAAHLTSLLEDIHGATGPDGKALIEAIVARLGR